MRKLIALTLFATACGGTQPKKESAIVPEGDSPSTCCCKTVPSTAEKEIVPSYTMMARMECSSANGECVDDVQCNGQEAGAAQGGDGVPPPPTLAPSSNGAIGE